MGSLAHLVVVDLSPAKLLELAPIHERQRDLPLGLSPLLSAAA
jgi:hypothetical protein